MKSLKQIFEKHTQGSLYHFSTGSAAFLNIIENNEWKLNGREYDINMNFLDKASLKLDWDEFQDRSADVAYYISFRRDPKFGTGYTIEWTKKYPIVLRYEFDAEKLKSLEKGSYLMPFNYVAFDNWDSVKNSNPKMYQGEKRYGDFWNQQEERFISYKSKIKDVCKYIKSVDILIDNEFISKNSRDMKLVGISEKFSDLFDAIRKSLTIRNINIRIFTDKNDFSKCINFFTSNNPNDLNAYIIKNIYNSIYDSYKKRTLDGIINKYLNLANIDKDTYNDFLSKTEHSIVNPIKDKYKRTLKYHQILKNNPKYKIYHLSNLENEKLTDENVDTFLNDYINLFLDSEAPISYENEDYLCFYEGKRKTYINEIELDGTYTFFEAAAIIIDKCKLNIK